MDGERLGGAARSDPARRAGPDSPRAKRLAGPLLVALAAVSVLLAVTLLQGGQRDPAVAPSASGGTAVGSPSLPTPTDPVPTTATAEPSGVPEPSATPTATPSAPSPASLGFIVPVEELVERARLAQQGEEPYASAFDELIKRADLGLGRDPKPLEPLRIKGQEGPFVRDAVRTYTLGLAYAATGDDRYAQGAARFIRAWVEGTTTVEDVCPDRGDCHTSLIMGRTAPGFVFGAQLIEDSAAFPAADRDAFQAWLRKIVMDNVSQRPNNWGDAGNFSRAAIAHYLGDTAELERVASKWREFLDLVTPDGQIPEETRRGHDGLQYTQEALQYKVAVAEIAALHGIDLWSYEGKAGGTLQAALDLFIRYWENPDDWPWHERVQKPSPGPLWEVVYARSPDPKYLPLLEESRPYGDRGHSALRWTTLTHGVPIDDLAG